jgi:hypothetical protein
VLDWHEGPSLARDWEKENKQVYKIIFQASYVLSSLNAFIIDRENTKKCFLSNSTMITNSNPLLSNAEWCRYCIHFRILNLNYFKISEIIGLKIITLNSSSMVSPVYQLSWNLSIGSKVTGTHTHTHTRTCTHTRAHTHTGRQAGDPISLLLIFGK